ncbi:hypothetical protein N0V90_008508 [Kalmusia sp. IMI 367209]|nr:hypothetical protein N0V90_008508 [Kalmusia sp. IMI 367209]
MVNLIPLTRDGLRDFLARRLAQPQTPEKKNPLTSFPSSVDLEAYPAPASFVVQGEIKSQLQSPLFGKIPPEIRNDIFGLALGEYVREGREIPRKSYVRRPGYEGLKSVDCALLRTCKAIYEETKVLPLRDLEVCFYMGDRRRAPEWSTMTKYTSINTSVHPRANWFKPEHWATIKHFHVFGQMCALQNGFRGLFRNDRDICQPTTLTLTLRYTDWWHWENNTRIFPIQPDLFFPMRDIEIPSTVQKVIVEFENIERKIKELEDVVGEMFQRREHWIWKRRDGRTLVVRGSGIEGDGVTTWRWDGPTTFGVKNTSYLHHGLGNTMGYVVKVVTWDLVKE